MGTAADWYRRAVVEVFRPLGDSEARFQVAYKHRKRADITGACAQLSRSAEEASSWLDSNPCPDPDLDRHVKGQVDACARLAQLIVRSEWRADDAEFMDRIDFHVADIQHKLLGHREAMATWSAGG